MAQIWLKGVDGRPDQFACSGVVTGARWILTATHCFKFAPYYEFFVRVGSTTLGEGNRHNVVSAKFRHDLAVLETAPTEGHLYTHGHPYAKLAPNKRVKLLSQLESYGWGKTCESCTASPVLKGAYTKVNDNEEGLRDSAGGPAYKVRALKARLRDGDSGGPSGYWGSPRVRVVTGVLSQSVTDSNRPADAYVSATYDDSRYGPKGDGTHDWLQREARMKVYEPHDELKRAIRVMALGSSTTWGEGSSDGNGYRDTVDRGLQQIADRNAGKTGESRVSPSLAEAGTLDDRDATPEVDWVGSVRVGTMPDRETEGWRGYRINEIAGKASCSVPLYLPNVVTVLAGGNDAIQNYQMDGAINRLEALIDQVTTDVPGATVLVAGLQPFHDPVRNARGEKFTAQIPALVDRFVQRGLSVVYTDISDLGPADIHTSDGIHPTDEGYDKIGAAFVKAANKANDQGWILEPLEQDGEAVSDACPTRDDGPGGTGGTGDNGGSKLGPGWKDHGVIQSQQFPSTNRFWMVDINKDRKAEFVTVDQHQNFRFWWNGGPSGKGWVPFVEGKNSYKPPAGVVGNQLRFADLDGDDFPDCVSVDLTGRLQVYTWKADNPVGARMCANKYEGVASVFDKGSAGKSLKIDPATKIRFADVTGGGRDDYLLIEPDGTTTAWYNRDFQNGDGRTWLDWTSPQNISGALQNPREIRYADINGDKRDDRILITAKGGARAWINEGPRGSGGTYRDIGKIAGDTGLPPKDIQFADVDGDGKDDFVRIGWTGVTHAWLNALPANYFTTFHP
ncbi:GDSL-type esterase/lipase family protein [Streptomyces marokkonensis]|uniref:GDSL-type esterase/lipase family protein n=1 Tax=Streptomyces marokkonensis TaxID=324855 RepID=A0ABW6QHW3_9ACTN